MSVQEACFLNSSLKVKHMGCRGGAHGKSVLVFNKGVNQHKQWHFCVRMKRKDQSNNIRHDVAWEARVNFSNRCQYWLPFGGSSQKCLSTG